MKIKTRFEKVIAPVVEKSRLIALLFLLLSAFLFSFSSYLSFLPVYSKTLNFDSYDSQDDRKGVQNVHVSNNEFSFLKKSVEVTGDFLIRSKVIGHPFTGLMQTSQINDGLRMEFGALGNDQYSLNIILNSKSSQDGIVGFSYGNPPYHLRANHWYRITAKLSQDNVLSGSLYEINSHNITTIIPFFETGVDDGTLKIDEIKVGVGFDDSRQFQGRINNFSLTYTYYLPLYLKQYGNLLSFIFLLLSLITSRLGVVNPRKSLFSSCAVSYLALIALIYMYPVLQFYSLNMINIDFHVVAKISLLLGLFGSVIFVVLTLVYRDVSKAFIGALFLAFILMFTGRIYDYTFTSINADIFVFIASLVFIFLHFVLLKVNSINKVLLNFLRMFVYLLSAMCVFSLAFNSFSQWRHTSSKKIAITVTGKQSSNKPDIYFIISDMYAGQPSLLKHMNYGNDAFLSHLKSLGFFVATNAASNYAYTWLSIPSMLNMSYLPDEMTSFPQLRDYYDNNALARYLKSMGYTYVHVITRPIILTRSKIADVNFTCGKTSDFEGMLWDYSFFFRLNTLADVHRNDVLCGFNRIKEATLIKGPKFVFVHILSPHYPYVFDKDGGRVAPDKQNDYRINSAVIELNKDGYLQQLQFISKKLTESVEFILAHSDKTPIIILQGDHGFSLDNRLESSNLPSQDKINARMRPLAAYLFPAGGNSVLYDAMTPVNMTRGLVRYYFHREDMGRIKDKAFWSTLDMPPKFTDVTAMVRNGDLGVGSST